MCSLQIRYGTSFRFTNVSLYKSNQTPLYLYLGSLGNTVTKIKRNNELHAIENGTGSCFRGGTGGFLPEGLPEK